MKVIFISRTNEIGFYTTIRRLIGFKTLGICYTCNLYNNNYILQVLTSIQILKSIQSVMEQDGGSQVV